MKKNIKLVLIVTIILFIGFFYYRERRHDIDVQSNLSWWNLQSIDTVKYSRDLAREKSDDPSFDEVIDTQTRLIAETGATHIAIGTPYDSEFVPYLKRWVYAARKYGLHVWFRGNFSGWEGWFGYERISRSEHTKHIQDFIINNKDLFADGDIFSPCTECENGGPGDPRITNDVSGFRNFLIKEYESSQKSFERIGEKVDSNYFSMNGDVAKLVMDKVTTKKLGGIVVIDHYVSTPEKLVIDIKNLAISSGGKVILGEFGVPIPDINGVMTDKDQADWINETLSKLAVLPELGGVNYWTGFGGSTQLWDSNYKNKLAVGVITRYYKPDIIVGVVKDERGYLVRDVVANICTKTVLTNKKGEFTSPNIADLCSAKISANGFDTQIIDINNRNNVEVTMIKRNKSWFYRVGMIVHSLLHF